MRWTISLLAMALSGCALLIGDLSLPPQDGPAGEAPSDGGEERDAAPPRVGLPDLRIGEDLPDLEDPADLAELADLPGPSDLADLAAPQDGDLDSPADGGQN